MFEQKEFWTICAACGEEVEVAGEHRDDRGNFTCTLSKRAAKTMIDPPFSVLVVTPVRQL